jgi:hypothetical protein
MSNHARTNLRQIRRRISTAHAAVVREIYDNASHGKYGAGLASEGYAGGYRDALDDVTMLLNGVEPQDHRGYFRKANHD